MTKHIGIVACSAEGAALCYRTICLESLSVLGEHDHPEITMNSIPLAQYMECIRRDDWTGVAELLLSSARKVAQAGATFAICPDNTCHQAFRFMLPHSPIPWLNIAEVVAEEANRRGFSRLGILGTRYLMESPVYAEALRPYKIACEIPDAQTRERVNTIIFTELVNGCFPEESRIYLNEVIEGLRKRGCDAAVLGCTELPIIVRSDDAPLPTLDSTRLLAQAALKNALSR